MIIALLAAISIPNLLRARIEAHDATAQASLKSISTALETYASTHSQYPPDTTSLIGVVPPYLSVDYFSGVHSGFSFTMTTLTSATYAAKAEPVSATSGSTTFTITTGGVLSKQ